MTYTPQTEKTRAKIDILNRLALALDHGVPFTTALDKALEPKFLRHYAGGLSHEVILEKINSGESVTNVLLLTGLFSEYEEALIKAAEAAGRIVKVSREIAELYRTAEWEY